MPNVYDVGDLVKISAIFTDEDDKATDPTVTTFQVTDPLGNTTTHVYGEEDGEMVGPNEGLDTGNFYVNVSIDKARTWYWRWSGTGAVQAAEEGSFVVRVSNIAPVA